MCGIAGIVSDDGAAALPDAVRMAKRQAHRGPDDAGSWADPRGRAAFAHARLSILDLSEAGRQPMTDAAGAACVVYNGEIYNFRELRRELENAGHAFRSGTDTEVLLHGYLAWGDSVVERLHGMFAFGIWDARAGRLLLARDRLGIKPLHYAEGPAGIAFASELKGLEAAPGAGGAVDASALWDFLTYLYVPAPKTAWRAIRKLPPGCTLVRERGGRAAIRRYWDADFARTVRRTDAECVEELRGLLARCVRDHLVSDVPVGVLLSGGIDSSAVTAYASAGRAAAPGGELRSFSVSFGGASVCEAPFARAVAERFGTRHVQEDSAPAQDAAELEELAAWFDEPFADASALPTSVVCRVARRDVPVVLSGDGGDELFGGYRRYGKFCRLARRDVAPRAAQRTAAAAVARLLPGGSGAARSLHRWGLEDVARYAQLHGGMTRPDKAAALPRAVTDRFAGYDDLWSFREHWREDLDPWSRMQYLDLKTYLPDDLLTKVDRMSMRWSLEVRPPLLDHRIVEFAASVPAAQRTPGGAMKGLFKRALAGTLGPESLDRGKQGFSIPIDPALFAGSVESAGWPTPQRVAWAMLKAWTKRRLAVADPREILREGP